MIIEKQIAVITGGGSGLGKACAQLLRQRGAEVVVWDKVPSKDKFTLQCDVRSEESVSRALEETIRQFGVPRICIQCAGVAPAARIVSKEGPMPLKAFQEVLDVNLLGVFNVMRLVADAMSREPLVVGCEERGCLINTASIAAYEGQIGQVAYSASKGGVISMTLPAARELAQWGIRVNCIAPGLMATPLLQTIPETVQQNLAQTVPFPNRLGAPEEFAMLAVQMIENSYLNGVVVRLDGALRMSSR